MAKKAGKNVRLRRKFGKNAPEMISSLVITSAYAAITELGANSYDADATEVHVGYYPHDRPGGMLKVTDNGLGMTPEDLLAFYRLGDSPKLQQRVTPRGRKCIGKFGVATILLKYLAKKYELITRKSGLETRVFEAFKGELRSNVEIPFTTTNIARNAHGTEITLRDLNFGEETGFSFGRLRRKLQWELPILPDFKLFLNGEEIETVSIKNATEFRIDKEWKHLGHLHGSIYMTGKATNVSGIHVYVNGRRVGDPQNLMYTHKRGLAKCIIGILHADNLEDAILFDRGKFREDHPGYRQLKDAVRQAMSKVTQYYRVKSMINRQDRIKSNVSLFLKKLRKTCLDAELKEVDRETDISLTDRLPKRTLGRFDAESNTLLLNERHSALFIYPGQTNAQYEAAMLNAFVDVLAEARVNEKGKISFADFLQEKEKIWRQINRIESEDELKERIHPLIVYSWKELSKQTGKSEKELLYFRARKVLPRDPESILGQEYLDFSKKVEGMVSLYSILEDIYEGDLHGTLELRMVEDGFVSAGNTARPFAKNLGTKRSPCIFIDSACAKDISELVADETFENHARERLQKLQDSYFSVPELAKKIEGDAKQVSRILDYAKKNSIEIRQKRPKKVVKFNYADFITAVQRMRKTA